MQLITRNLFVFGLLIFLLDACYSPPTDIPPGNKEVEYSHDNELRRTIFYIPKKLKRRKRSLILCLHNDDETIESMMRLTRRSFNRLADENGFIIGYPEALNKYWNDGREDSISLSHYNEIDDVGFIEKVIDYGIDSFHVNPSRIFVAGMSNGGFMSLKLACELSQKINGIAAVSASLALDQLVNCSADTTVSVMLINGTRDPVMPYEGGEMIFDDRSQGSILSSEETVNYWLRENECKEKMTMRDVSNSNLFDETRSEKYMYTNCENNAKVVLIAVTNGGHTWPGGRQYLGERVVGKTAKDFDASEEIWKFFKGL